MEYFTLRQNRGGSAVSELSVGSSEVLALSDGSLTVPFGFFSNTTEAQKAAVGETIQLAANTYAYRNGDRVFLFDTGSGVNHFISAQFPTLGTLSADLALAEIDPTSVTDIVITHLHVDHIGGLVVNGAAVFPNATVHIAQKEWDFWTKTGLEGTVPDPVKPMVAAA